MLDHIAWQRLRQPPAGGLAPGCFGRGSHGFRRLGRGGFRDLLFQVAQHQLKLLDRAAQLLRRGAEALAQQLGQAQLQLLVAQHLLLQPSLRRRQIGRLLLLHGNMLRLALQQQAAQGGHVARQCGRVEGGGHERIVPHRFAPQQAA
jgi:hypothetical protein